MNMTLIGWFVGGGLALVLGGVDALAGIGFPAALLGAWVGSMLDDSEFGAFKDGDK